MTAAAMTSSQPPVLQVGDTVELTTGAKAVIRQIDEKQQEVTACVNGKLRRIAKSGVKGIQSWQWPF